MKHKCQLAAVVLLIFFVFITGCQERVPSNPKVALVLPLTGVLAPWGKACEQAVRLQLEGEKHFQLLVFDNRADPEETKRIFTLIVHKPDIVAAIGPLKCVCLQSALPIIREEPLPTISPGCFQDFIKESKGWAIPLLSELEEIKAIADFLNKRHLSWALFYENNGWGQSLSQLLQSMVKASPSVSYMLHTADISTLRPQLQEVKPKAIVIFLSPAKASLLALQIKEIGLNSYILGPYCFLDSQFYAVLAPIADKVLITTPQLSSKQATFEKEFIKHYYTNPSWIATCAYAAMDAILKAPRFSRKAIKKDFKKRLSLRFNLLPVAKSQD